MNFQSVSVGQKTAGYVDAAGTPTAPLVNALDFVDAQLGRLVAELKQNGLLAHTLVVISAKHAQAPIDPALRRIVSSKLVPSIVNGVQAGLLAAATLDDIAILWLTDASKTSAVVSALDANAGPAGIASNLTTSQIAPTILEMLGLDPAALDAVRAEGTRPLPGAAE